MLSWRELGQGDWQSPLVKWAFVVAIAMTTVRSGLAGGAFWLLAIAGLLMILRDIRTREQTPGGLSDPQSRWDLIGSMAVAPILLNVLSVWLYNLPLREASWWPILAFPLLLRIAVSSRIGIETLQQGALWGNTMALLMVVFTGLWFGDARTHLPGNVIIFGQIVMALCAINAWSLGSVTRLPDRLLRLTTLLAGLTAVMAVGYRGGLLILPMVIVAYMLACGCRSRVSWRSLTVQAVLACTVMSLFAVIAGSFLSIGDRLALFQTEFETYQSGHIEHSSSGSRVALWQAAWTLFERHPWVGIGAHQFHSGLDRLRLENAFPVDVLLFHHAHNTYLNLAAEYGLVGLVVFAAVGVLLWRGLGASDRATRLLGRCVLICWLVAALTNDITAHQATLRALLLMLIPCLACGPLVYRPMQPIGGDSGQDAVPAPSLATRDQAGICVSSDTSNPQAPQRAPINER